jgi:hypothetical protein
MLRRWHDWKRHSSLVHPDRAEEQRKRVRSHSVLKTTGRHDELRLSPEFTDFEAEITVVSL